MTPGTVVTFYSYKGGVGRSFALANVAVLLSRWGFRVLCIDWDIEAPGLSHYFSRAKRTGKGRARTRSRVNERPGLVDLFNEFESERPLDWRSAVERVDRRLKLTPTSGAEPSPTKNKGSLSLISAGRDLEDYSLRAQQIDWPSLYEKGLGQSLEQMFADLRQNFDFVLIDSRTGVTDFAGVITAQLPDILLFLFTANDQSLEGSIRVARRAAAARNNIALDRSKLLQLPIPARFEVQLEHRISNEWRDRFAFELREFYEPWLARDVDVRKFVHLTTIPYVPFWSFGERLAVLEESSSDPQSVSFSLETIAALLSHRLGQTRLLNESRDDFVAAARRRAKRLQEKSYSFFISYAHDDRPMAAELANILSERGSRVFFDQHIRAGQEWTKALEAAISQSDHMLVLVSPQSEKSRWVESEIRMFLRQASSDEAPRLVVPCLIGGATPADLPPLLSRHQAIRVSNVEDAARQIERATSITSE